MGKEIRKYTLLPLAVLLVSQMVFGLPSRILSEFAMHRADDTLTVEGDVVLIPDSLVQAAVGGDDEAEAEREENRAAVVDLQDTTWVDSLMARPAAGADTARRPDFLDDIVDGRNKDSLVYYVRSRKAFMYGGGDVTYQVNNLRAEFMEVDMQTKEIQAYSYFDTVTDEWVKPVFTQEGKSYEMDSVRHNLQTNRTKLWMGFMQEGEGFLIGNEIKKMDDNTINVRDGRYTTCDHIDHPHFFIHMNRAKVDPGRKIFFGRTSLWIEDVPIPFIIPFGYAPLSTGRRSGWIMPDWGEEYVKGFFIRNGGYYFAINEYMDSQVTGGIYTLGSWELANSSRYFRRYKYTGSVNLNFTKDIIGERSSPDFVEGNNFRINWNHTQDGKFRPNSNFSASVNYSTSGYSRFGSTDMQERISSQTSSSIAYSRRFGNRTSLTTNMSHSQNSNDSTVYLGFPNAVLSVANFSPFGRGKNSSRVGKERWYEKITMRYTGELRNNVTVHERDLFTQTMWDNMKNGVRHAIPVSASFPVLKYINISPSFNYNERWYFKRIEREWDSGAQSLVISDTTQGFYRVFDYNFAMSATTKLFGMYDFGTKFPISRLRHMMTPSVSLAYTPDFSDPRFGIYREVEDDDGNMRRYSPYEGAIFGYPGTGRSAALRFSLQNTLEAKVRSKQDTTGFRKVRLIDELSASSSYNFLADSLNLSPFSLGLRVPITKNYSLNLRATLDPYEVDERGRRLNRFMLRRGKLGRITNANWAFDYTFSSKGRDTRGSEDKDRQTNEDAVTPDAFFSDPNNPETMLDAATRRRIMSQQYYDFSMPWSLSFSYSFNYSNNGVTQAITQTVSFQSSVTLTEKMGLNFSAGYDFKYKKMTPGVLTFARDLHCWQMSFSWVPVGFYKSWSFNIAVKSALLQDLKWDKQSSYFDNLRD